MFETLSMVTRFVSDQDEAVAFYTEKLGFTITMDHPGPHGRFLAVAPTGDDVDLILMSPDGFDDADDLAKLIGNDAGLIYEVDDCQETFESLRTKGVEFREEPEEMPWGIQAVALDQDRNEIVIQERVDETKF